MRYLSAPIGLALLLAAGSAPAYVEAPYSLGRTCQESTHVVLVELVRVNKEKNLLVYKKVRDLKGKHPENEIKHNIGQRGKHEREWRTVMAWAEVTTHGRRERRRPASLRGARTGRRQPLPVPRPHPLPCPPLRCAAGVAADRARLTRSDGKNWPNRERLSGVNA